MMHKDWILISAAALLLTTSCGKTPSSGQNSTEYSSEEFSSLFCDGCWYLDSVNGVYDWESAGKDIPSYCLKPKRDGTMIRYHGLPWAPEDGYDLSYSLSEWSYDEKTGALSFDAKDVIRIASVKSINQSVLKLIVIENGETMIYMKESSDLHSFQEAFCVEKETVGDEKSCLGITPSRFESKYSANYDPDVFTTDTPSYIAAASIYDLKEGEFAGPGQIQPLPYGLGGNGTG